MVREIVLKAWCDFHMVDGEPVEASHAHKVSIDGKSFTVDLCNACDATKFEPLAALIFKHSAREGADPKPPAPESKSRQPGYRPPSHAPGLKRPCFLCDKVSTDRNAFDRHMEKEHDTTPTGAFGLVCPLCESEFKRPQGLGVHSARAHGELGISTVPELFQYAIAHGDALGIVAKRRAMFAKP